MNALLLSAWRTVADNGSAEVRLDRCDLSDLVAFAEYAASRIDHLTLLLRESGIVLARCAEGADDPGEAEMQARAVAEVLR